MQKAFEAVLQRGDLLLEGGILLGNALGHVGLHLEKLGGQVLIERASIWQAKMAALSAPSMATVATGCRRASAPWESSASRPSKVEDFTGMPMTGKVVWAASTPARWAAFPRRR